MNHPQLILKGELVFRTAYKAKAVKNTEDGWYAINIVISDGQNQGKIIVPLSLAASLDLYRTLLPEIMHLDKKIFDKGNGEYQFDPEILVGEEQ